MNTTTYYYPAKRGGKYHRTFLGLAACRPSIELDTSPGAPILHEDGERLHPIICKLCSKSGHGTEAK
jgi:hypothetical protein